MILTNLAQELYDVDRDLKELEQRKRTLRGEFFSAALAGASNGHLPQKIVVIPPSFWSLTGLSEATFFSTRYPSWIVKAHTEDTYVLEKNADFIPWSFTDEESKIRLAKQVQEFQPEIDWMTLQKDQPEVFDAIARPKITYELDEAALEEAVTTFPDLPDILTRHLTVKRPVLKLAPIKKVVDE